MDAKDLGWVDAKIQLPPDNIMVACCVECEKWDSVTEKYMPYYSVTNGKYCHNESKWYISDGLTDALEKINFEDSFIRAWTHIPIFEEKINRDLSVCPICGNTVVWDKNNYEGYCSNCDTLFRNEDIVSKEK